MSELLDRLSTMTPKRLALLVMDLQSRLEASQRKGSEPIAIIGMACRFPGADSPEAFWDILQRGVDVIRDIPSDRFDVDALFDPDPEAIGKIATRWGGFLDDIDKFDAHLFGIAPREADGMDPQQRLLLETAWEALERSGYAPDALRGSRVGVFAGLCNSDHAQMLLGGDRNLVDAYTATGNAHSVAAGRISYVMGLQGPSIAVDTACSSSLVALHLAIQSLRAGECEMAIAGGSNVILSPDTTITLSRARMMAPDGRCKAFSEAADGFVRSEGCGVVTLKRLDDAIAAGDPILAVVRGTAINQDGRSNGITAPNGPSQEAVVRAAVADAGLRASEIQYIEAHGTGTSLGDPIEAQALGAALGQREDSGPLLIGSVKTNMGHLEATAGIAGVMKVVLMLQHGSIPPSLHFNSPSQHIPWSSLPLRVPTALESWTQSAGERAAGVSSFGFSGTNVHVVIQGAPSTANEPGSTQRPAHLLKLAAATDDALRQSASRYAAALAADDTVDFADFAHTANVARSDLPRRAAIVASDAASARQALEQVAAGVQPDGVSIGTAGQRTPPVAFLFTGQGAQYAGMGQELYECEPVFREALVRCAELLRPYLDRPLLDIMFATPDTPESALLDQTAYTQPAMFAIEYALAALWQSWGVRPATVVGHSLGEFTAACVAGILSLEDALRLVAARGRLMSELPASGEMAAVFASEQRVQSVLGSLSSDVAIAAVNGPESVTLSGEGKLVEEAVTRLHEAGIEARLLRIPLAAHCSQVDPILDRFEAEAAAVHYLPPQIDFISGMSGRLIHGDEIDAAYWRRQLREPVRFADAMQTLIDRGHTVFVESGPHPVLFGIARQYLPQGTLGVASLRRGHAPWETILHSLGELYVAGVEVDWDAFNQPFALKRIVIPTYPFQRERHWHVALTTRRTPAAVLSDESSVGLHGRPVLSPALSGSVFETRLGVENPAFLADHCIHGLTILPSPVYLELFRQAGEAELDGAWVLEDIQIREALVLPKSGTCVVQTILKPDDDGADVEIFGRETEQEHWTRYAEARLTRMDAVRSVPEMLDIENVLERCSEEISPLVFYDGLASLGLEFGPAFRSLGSIHRRTGEALGRLELPQSVAAERAQYGIHPALLDSCFHLLGAALDADYRAQTYLMIGIDSFRLHSPPEASLWNHATLRDEYAGSAETFSGDVRLYDDDGNLVAEALGLQLKRATSMSLARRSRRSADEMTYEVVWQQAPQVTSVDLHAGVETQIAAEIRDLLSPVSEEHGLAMYQHVLPELDKLSALYVERALSSLGMEFNEGHVYDSSQLRQRLGVLPHYRRLLQRMLVMLSEDGVVRETERGLQVIRQPNLSENPDTRVAALHKRYPQAQAEISVTARCGSRLADVLRGVVEPLQLLFPNGSLEPLEQLYRLSPFARVFNDLMQSAVRTATTWLSAERPLRVLEIGAGTGATTDAALAALPLERTKYWFTDVSPLFLDRARARYTGIDGMRFAAFDVEREPLAQQIPAGVFDIVICANVIHATADIAESLGNIRNLLAPDGLLLMLEGTQPRRWVDLTFGLTDGWWRFADTQLRPDYPLLQPETWTSTLSGLGFSTPVATGYGQDGPVDQVLIVAGAPHAMPVEPANWLIVPDNEGLGTAIADRLRARGEAVQTATPDSDLTELLNTGTRRSSVNVLYLAGLDLPAPDTGAEIQTQAATDECAQIIDIVRGLAGHEETARLWIVTRGAHAVEGAVTAPLQSTLWGLGRVLALEQPEIWGGLLDIDPAFTHQEAVDQILEELNGRHEEDQVALRGQERFVARLAPVHLPATPAITLRDDASYLITGGTGGLGLKIARWMVEQGARSIVLTSRTGLPDRHDWDSITDSRIANLIGEILDLESEGATIHVVAADVADRRQMTAMFERIGNELPPLRGIVHAAAHLGAFRLRDLQRTELEAMLRPKVAGTLLLHELSRDMSLDFLVLFSSTTALWGSSQLGHYAAANTFLDGFAQWRSAEGQPALSVNWGTWDEMRVASADEQRMVAGFGLSPMPSDTALDVLGRLLTNAATQVAVADVDWQVLKPAYSARRVRPFLSLVGQAEPAVKATTEPEQSSEPRLQQILKNGRQEDLRIGCAEFVQAEVAATLGTRTGRSIDPQQGLFQLGLDSLMAVDLKGRLEAGIGHALPSTVVFNHPTIDALTDYMLAEYQSVAAAPQDDVQTIAQEDVPPDQPEPETDFDEMSEDELEVMLARRLARVSGTASSVAWHSGEGE